MRALRAGATTILSPPSVPGGNMVETAEQYLEFLIDKKFIAPVSQRRDSRFFVFNTQANIDRVYPLITSIDFIFELSVELKDPSLLLVSEVIKKSGGFSSLVYKRLDELRQPIASEPLCLQIATGKSAPVKRENVDLDIDFLLSLHPFVDVNSGEIVLWDYTENNISEVSYEAYKNLLPPKEMYNLKKSGAFTPCKKIYDPYDFSRRQKTKIDGLDAVALNSYNPPDWRLKQYGPYYHPPIKRFLEHLFPIEEERALVLTFLKHMILFRVSWIFLLLGNKGIGKGIFVDHICQYLVGAKYFAKAPKGFFDSRFQDVLINNRLIFFDEINVKTTEGKNDIKRLCNKLQSVEVKGKNSEQYSIYYSTIMANNSLRDIKVESDDRRFFIPKTSEVPLDRVFSFNETQELVNYFTLEENCGAFGNYLISLEDSSLFNQENAYLTETFYQAVDLSLSDVERFIVATLKSGEETFYPFKVLKNHYKGDQRFFSENKIREFIKNHTERGIYLGVEDKEDGEDGIRVNQKLIYGG